jgi:outer membrane protein assembly factor BamE (lipoprotein component of BamABCDE complex)
MKTGIDWRGFVGLGLLILFFGVLAMCDRAGSSAQREAQRQAQLKQEQRELENLVERHSFAVGMTKDQVTRALGQPARVNRSVRANSVSEQWIYEFSNGKTIYLYIDNGILRSFQDSR